MPYLLRAFNPTTNVVETLRLEARDSEAATREAERQGLVVLEARKVEVEVSADSTSPRRPASARLDVAWWCRELRTLLLAGMTVVEALETLGSQKLGAERDAANSLLVRHLRQGRALSAAMEASGAFPTILVTGIKASERTSTLTTALEDFLQYHELLQSLQKRVVSAAIYPSVVASLGLVVTLFLLGFVMPRFSKLYEGMEHAQGAATQLLLSASKLLTQHGGVLALAVAGLIGLAVLAWRDGQLGRMMSSVLDRIEPLQAQIDHFRLSKLYHSLALMTRGGFPLEDSMGQCSSLSLGPRVDSGIERARQELLQGRRVSTAFMAGTLTDGVSERLLAVGERSGNFDRVLQTIARRHSEQFETFIERTTRLVEPLMLLAVSLLVGGIVVLMYMPVFDIASSLG